MKNYHIFNRLFFLLLIAVIISSCGKDNPTKPEALNVIGLVITQGDSTKVHYSGDETVTG